MEKYLTFKQAAELLGITVEGVRPLVRRENLQVFKAKVHPNRGKFPHLLLKEDVERLKDEVIVVER